MQPNHWLPLTEYALRSGMSISTLRRKIKANSIEFRMEEGRYLIRSDDIDGEPARVGYVSSDAPQVAAVAPPLPVSTVASGVVELEAEIRTIREEVQQSTESGSLRWRALEARVVGLAKKLEAFSEQVAELKMLVKIFEEKLDRHG